MMMKVALLLLIYAAFCSGMKDDPAQAVPGTATASGCINEEYIQSDMSFPQLLNELTLALKEEEALWQAVEQLAVDSDERLRLARKINVQIARIMRLEKEVKSRKSCFKHQIFLNSFI